MGIKTKFTMQKECAIIVITNTEEQKSHGIALMRNFTLLECVRIVTSTIITERKGNKRTGRAMKIRRLTIKASNIILVSNEIVKMIILPS